MGKKSYCPPRCPICGEGDLAGGGALKCRYTCGHVTDAEVTEESNKPRGKAWSKKTAKQGQESVRKIREK
jgi:hypothetical protein